MSIKLSSSIPTDREVVLGILNNSEEALNRLYLGYFPMVLQFILNNSGDEADAKDVYQEAIIVLYNKIKSGNFELSSKLKTYLFSVSRRIWLKMLAQQSKKTNIIADFEVVLAVEEDVDQVPLGVVRELNFRHEAGPSAVLLRGQPVALPRPIVR